jgi:hypothetical protein
MAREKYSIVRFFIAIQEMTNVICVPEGGAIVRVAATGDHSPKAETAPDPCTCGRMSLDLWQRIV